jgi:30S ribosomal protein S31
MGKGDRRTRRGKIWRKSFGKARPRNPDKPETAVAAAPTPPAAAKKPTKKATKKAAQ